MKADWSWKPDRKVRDALKNKKRRKPKRLTKAERRRARKKKLCRMRGEDFYKTNEWKGLRSKILAKYGRKCMKCDRETGPMQVDHIEPRSKAPKKSLLLNNLQVLCMDCNMEKSNLHATDYREEAIARWNDAEILEKMRDWI